MVCARFLGQIGTRPSSVTMTTILGLFSTHEHFKQHRYCVIPIKLNMFGGQVGSSVICCMAKTLYECTSAMSACFPGVLTNVWQRVPDCLMQIFPQTRRACGQGQLGCSYIINTVAEVGIIHIRIHNPIVNGQHTWVEKRAMLTALSHGAIKAIAPKCSRYPKRSQYIAIVYSFAVVIQP